MANQPKRLVENIGVKHTLDRNGGLVVDAESLLTNPRFRRQVEAAEKIGKALEQLRRQKPRLR